jgi:hypothetical protein
MTKVGACLADYSDEAGEEGGQKCPEVGEDFADVVTAAAKHGVEGITEGALEGAAGEASSVLMWPISGSMVPRRRSSLRGRCVRPRRVPLTSTLVLCTPWPR